MTISATTQGLRMGVATSSSRPAVPFDGQVISETDTDSLSVYNGTAWVGVAPPIAIFNETQANTTVGGTAASGSWIKRVLNTTVANTITGCSLATSVITLTAGTYYVFATAPFWGNMDRVGIRLQNTTDSTTAVQGQAGGSSATLQSNSNLMGYFTIASSKDFEVQFRVQTASANVAALGLSLNFGSSEIYTQISITKVA